MTVTLIDVCFDDPRWEFSCWDLNRHYPVAVLAADLAYIREHGFSALTWNVTLTHHRGGYYRFRFVAPSPAFYAESIDGEAEVAAQRSRNVRGMSLANVSTRRLLEWLRDARRNRYVTENDEDWGYRTCEGQPHLPVATIKTELRFRPHLPRKADRKAARQKSAHQRNR